MVERARAWGFVWKGFRTRTRGQGYQQILHAAWAAGLTAAGLIHACLDSV